MRFGQLYPEHVILKRDEHRLFSHMDHMLVLMGALFEAMERHLLGTVQMSFGTGVGLECNHSPKAPVLPLVGCLEAALRDQPINSIMIGFTQNRRPSGDPHATLPKYTRVIMYGMTPVFVDFYEANCPWLTKNVSTDGVNWPAPWDFGRAVRNACAHGGRLWMPSPNARPVSWRDITYDHSRHGELIIGKDITAGDLVSLWLEMSDALDMLNAPL